MIQPPPAATSAETAVWIVTVDPAAQLAEVVEALRHAGLSVDQVYDSLSVIIVNGNAAAAAAARAVPNVTSVEKQLTFDIGPPNI